MARALIVMDAFKGCLSSMDAGEAARRALTESGWKDKDIVCLPMSDGGEGFVDVMSRYQKDVRVMTADVHDPLMRPVKASYILCNEFRRTAYMESASVLGYPLIADGERNALNMTSYGLGELIRHAADNGARVFCIGLGGTAVCDGGMGMLQALGVRLRYGRGMSVYRKEALFKYRLNSFDCAEMICRDMSFRCFCDTTAPFCGEGGAVRVYGPQKGIPQESIEETDKWMADIARAVARKSGVNIASMPRAGAAGGLGGTFAAFMDAELLSGSEKVMEESGLSTYLQDPEISLVITGEGHLDSQTRTGKMPYGVAGACHLLRNARSSSSPRVVCLAGMVDPGCGGEFDAAIAVTPPDMLENGKPSAAALEPTVAASNITAALKSYLQSADFR